MMGGRLEWVCDWFLGDFIFIGVRKYLIFLCKAATTLSEEFYEQYHYQQIHYFL